MRPGVKGLSENIRVVSIIDRFLEHSRIFCFHHGGSRRVFISSADWMPRNLDRRLELLVPVTDKACKRKLVAILDTCFSDTVSASEILPDGGYMKIQPTGRSKPVRAQEVLYRKAQEEARQTRRDKNTTLIPHVSPEKRKSSEK